MRDRRGKRDAAHALAAHARQRHLDAALLADDALVLHPLIFAAQALVVLDRSEDARAEQAVTLRLERAVIDRLGLLDLAEGPRKNLFRARDRDLDLIERLRSGDGGEGIGDFLVHCGLPRGRRSKSAETRIHGNKGVTQPATAKRSKAAKGHARYSAASAGGSGSSSGVRLIDASSTFSPSERISLTSTLKLSGMPDSNVSSPRTIDSYTLVRPATSSDLTVSISCSV